MRPCEMRQPPLRNRVEVVERRFERSDGVANTSSERLTADSQRGTFDSQIACRAFCSFRLAVVRKLRVQDDRGHRRIDTVNQGEKHGGVEPTTQGKCEW